MVMRVGELGSIVALVVVLALFLVKVMAWAGAASGLGIVRVPFLRGLEGGEAFGMDVVVEFEQAAMEDALLVVVGIPEVIK